MDDSEDKGILADARGEVLRINGLLVAERFKLDDIEDQIEILGNQGCPPTYDLYFKQMAALKRVRESDLAYISAVRNYFKIKQLLADEQH